MYIYIFHVLVRMNKLFAANANLKRYIVILLEIIYFYRILMLNNHCFIFGHLLIMFK